VLDADASPEAIAAQIRERVQSLLG
jgi:hypothetical protein